MTTTEKTTDREIVITRLLNAPRELVFKAWTDPAHLINWWGPRGYTNTFKKTDIRVGGEWTFMMHAPDGTDYPNKIEYQKIVEPELLEYIHSDDNDGEDAMRFFVTVTFEKRGNQTQLTMRTLFPTAEARDFVVREVNAIELGNQTIDCLEEELAKM